MPSCHCEARNSLDFARPQALNTFMNAKMVKRIVFGLAMIAIMAGVFYLDWRLSQDRFNISTGLWEASSQALLKVRGLPLACLFLLLISLAVWEVRKMAAAAGLSILPASSLLTSLALATLPFWWQLVDASAPDGGVVLAILGAAICLIFAEQMLRASSAGAFGRIAASLLTMTYLGIAGGIVLNIRVQFGLAALILFLAAVKFTDIGAYFTGSAIGKHKLIPWLSPGKSWEGLAGGLAVSAIVTILIAWALGIELAGHKMTITQAAIFGAIVGLVGQFGDLCESLLKRSVNIKDSGHLMPEFGGILDILDSPLLAAPAAYAMLAMMAR